MDSSDIALYINEGGDMDKLMDTKEVMEYLSVPRITVYYLIRKKGLPVIKIGRRMLRFSKKDIDNWLDTYKNYFRV